MAIKVILRQDVPNLGSTGEVKQVAPGYFRNYLLPRGLATEATAGQLKALENNTSSIAKAAARAKERAGTLAGQLGQTTIRIPVKVGEQGRLYGSITNKDIAQALSEQAGVTVDRHKIELREPLRSVGAHSVPVKLEHGVDATVNVELVPESEPAEA